MIFITSKHVVDIFFFVLISLSSLARWSRSDSRDALLLIMKRFEPANY